MSFFFKGIRFAVLQTHCHLLYNDYPTFMFSQVQNTDRVICQCFKLSDCCSSYSASSYSPCLIALDRMYVHNLLLCLLPIISGIDVPPWQDAKLFRKICLDLILPLFLSKFSVVLTLSSFHLFMMSPKIYVLFSCD